MAPRACRLSCLFLIVTVVLAGDVPEQGMFARATELYAEGRHAEALRVLRSLRIDYPDSDLMPDVLLLSARASLAEGDGYRGRYFLQLVVDGEWTGKASYDSHLLLADLYYDERMFTEALELYRIAANLLEREADPEAAVRARVYLRIGEIGMVHAGRGGLARAYLQRIDPSLLVPEDLSIYLMVRRRAQWDTMPVEAVGLTDPNISALASDGDDLWIGTWNGGVSRLACSSGVYTVFEAGGESLVADTVRAIEVTPREVWVGTYQGLSRYSKGLSRWTAVPEFGAGGSRGNEGSRVQAVLAVDGRVLVGTLGEGLWSLEEDAWGQVGEAELAGGFINCLGASRAYVLIGTMDRGLVLLRRTDETMVPADAVYPQMRSRNITFVLEARDGTIWVGTYGEGLYRLGGTEVRHYTSAGGGVLDDWVMCGAESDRAVYVGTFGGGVSVFGRDGAVDVLGIEDGLSSLDVMSVCCSRGVVYFGTLGAGISVYHEEL